ncbi:hypothetical protein AA0616_1926 [Komagataeibacter nataicola NRIC 0616]|nr:hypothetical protein AA0616_1926 [Komagataeibacter nataicola NRIC 0616]
MARAAREQGIRRIVTSGEYRLNAAGGREFVQAAWHAMRNLRVESVRSILFSAGRCDTPGADTGMMGRVNASR